MSHTGVPASARLTLPGAPRLRLLFFLLESDAQSNQQSHGWRLGSGARFAHLVFKVLLRALQLFELLVQFHRLQYPPRHKFRQRVPPSLGPGST
eukprot:246163-Rhodomonas_salina.4